MKFVKLAIALVLAVTCLAGCADDKTKGPKTTLGPIAIGMPDGSSFGYTPPPPPPTPTPGPILLAQTDRPEILPDVLLRKPLEK